MSAIQATMDQLPREIAQRRAELEQLQALYGQLQAIYGHGTATNGATTTKKPQPAKRRQRAASGTRHDQALKYIQENPGATARDIANSLGVVSTYGNNLCAALVKEGKIIAEPKRVEVRPGQAMTVNTYRIAEDSA